MIELDFTNVLDDAVGTENGIPAEVFEQAEASLERTVDKLEAERAAGRLGFADLPSRQDVVDAASAFAERHPYPHVLVVGIGGSGLGPIALDDALNNRSYGRKLSALDNVDPDFIRGTLDRLNPRDVVVNVIAKSGVTAETMATFSVVRRWLIDALGEDEARSRFVVTTDREKGDLLGIARQEGYPAFEIPSNVGGRFSVLSPVGILPAALLGLDVAGLMSGAKRAAQRARRPPGENAALQLAFIQWFLDRERGKSILTLFPYCQSLWKFAFWYKQLWGESLGKKEDRRGHTVHVGQTPTAALGVTDQHSQLQLFIEGPNDKSFVFWDLKDFRNKLTVDGDFSHYASLGYLEGRDIGELLHAEREATEIALTEAGRPSVAVSADRLDEDSFGELIMFSEYATAYAGELYDINAFDQPGVDYGKRLTFSMMGRDGFSDYDEKVEQHRIRKRAVIR